MVKIKHVKELKIKATDTYGSENVRTIRIGDYLLIDVGYGMQSYAVNNIVYTKDNMFSTYIELVSEDGTTLVFQWYKLVETIFAFDINIFIAEMYCEYNEYDVLIGDRIIDIIRIGDYVDYTPTGSKSYVVNGTYSGTGIDQTINVENLNWRVFDKTSDNKIRLISEKSTMATIKFQGGDGYNNCVYLLDELCNSLYQGKKATSKNSKLHRYDKRFYLLYMSHFFVFLWLISWVLC